MNLLIMRNELLTEVASRTKLKPARWARTSRHPTAELEPSFEKSRLTEADRVLVSAKFKTFLFACGG